VARDYGIDGCLARNEQVEEVAQDNGVVAGAAQYQDENNVNQDNK